MKKFTDFYKQAAALLTPQAQAAATAPQGGAPMDPSMMSGMPPQGMPSQGAPMDPAMMGGAPMPPAGGMPMDPAAMQGMPPQGGAPMDPSMMGGAPMDPAAMQGMPADPAAMGGAPQGAWMQDPQFMQFIQQMGIQMDPQSGMVMGPDGQPVPPQIMDQMYAEFQNQMAAAQQGGMPPEQGMPPEGQMPQPGLDEQTMNNMASIIMDSVDSVLEQKMATLDKKLSAFAEKLDSIKSLIDDLALGTDNMQKQEQLQNDKLNAQLEEQLKTIQDLKAQPVQSTEDILKSAAQQKPLRSILDIMRG